MKKKGFAGQTVWTREVFVLCLVLFALCSVLCGLCVSEATDRLIVEDGSGNVMFDVTDAGQVGIGGAVPSSSMPFYAVLNGAPAWIDRYSSDANASGIVYRKARGTSAAPQAVAANDYIGTLQARAFNGSSFLTVGNIRVGIEGVNGSNLPSFMSFNVQEGVSGTLLERMRINSLGNVGIGTTTPEYPLHMGSGAYVTPGGVWTNASSREYKENISELSTKEAIETLKGLSPVKFNYKTDNEDKHVGFIAEDVPDLVATKDRKGLSPMDIVAVLTKVVQEERKTISELTEKVDQLESQVNRISTNNMVVNSK